MEKQKELGEKMLTEDEVNGMINDPATIETHEQAIEIMDILNQEISSIQSQIDAAQIRSNAKPMDLDEENWLKRASFACSIRKREYHKVCQRDKEIRGTKGKAFTPPKHTPEEKILKQQRLLEEAQVKKAKRLLEIETQKRIQSEAAERNRQMKIQESFYYKFSQAAHDFLDENTYAEICNRAYKII